MNAEKDKKHARKKLNAADNVIITFTENGKGRKRESQGNERVLKYAW